jgi:uncharacterized membrane protein
MKKISQLFLQGLFAILPIIITFYIIYWLGSLAESTLGKLLQLVFPSKWYLPGMGIIAGFALTVSIGILLKAYLFRQLASLTEKLLQRIPLVKTVYASVRDISKFAASSKNDELQKTVLVTLDNDIKVLGFITQKNLPFDENNQLLAVYVPMSYQIGGFTLILPESRIETINMKAQDAMRFVVTAGMTSTNHRPRPDHTDTQ